jgi:uncharacterized protein (DUF2236 family)
MITVCVPWATHFVASGTQRVIMMAVAGDLGCFGPDSVTWQVLTDPAAGVGGIRGSGAGLTVWWNLIAVVGAG